MIDVVDRLYGFAEMLIAGTSFIGPAFLMVVQDLLSTIVERAVVHLSYQLRRVAVLPVGPPVGLLRAFAQC